VFKGNSNVKLIVLTGCLRIADESIFTGANNVMVYDLDNEAFSGFYGLTEDELSSVLMDNGIIGKLDEFKAWYNGYNYGGRQIYNISSVLSYISALQINANKRPENYWTSTSSNNILSSAMEANYNLDNVIALMAGKSVRISDISNAISYRGVKREDSLWSILHATGYVTRDANDANAYRIPNEEIKSSFKEFFKDHIKDKIGLAGIAKLHSTVKSLDSKRIEDEFKKSLQVLSVFDTAVNHEYVYHVFFAGVLSNLTLYSNRESGFGRYDVQIEFQGDNLVLIFEFKRFEDGDQNLADAAQRALNQIFALHYADYPKSKGYNVVCFGVGCSGKDCAVIGGIIA
jgi:hypothetical protein